MVVIVFLPQLQMGLQKPWLTSSMKGMFLWSFCSNAIWCNESWSYCMHPSHCSIAINISRMWLNMHGGHLTYHYLMSQHTWLKPYAFLQQHVLYLDSTIGHGSLLSLLTRGSHLLVELSCYFNLCICVACFCFAWIVLWSKLLILASTTYFSMTYDCRIHALSWHLITHFPQFHSMTHWNTWRA